MDDTPTLQTSQTIAQNIDAQAIQRCILQKLKQRGTEKSICPSEVARELGGEQWRSLMPLVRQVGIELADAGRLVITQQGHPIHPHAIKGPVRFQQIRQHECPDS
ncbi:MAG TPA: DUF3253 domain-containing protein [Synechococcales cyanobacterium M55_K2018_004]|nr:DUF3253 domain-containing protein [Synechococcales cyanobacterium M55_K2018_004]